MVRKLVLVVLVVGLLLSAFSLVAAQDMTAVATGLNSPRQLFIGSDGSVYVAEAGIGGDIDGEGAFGPIKFGASGQITAVSPEGEQSVVIPGLISTDTGFGQIHGAHAVIVTDDSYWVAVGDGPIKGLEEGQHVSGVIQYAKEGMAMEQFIDTAAWEAENNPDENPDDVVSNPVDLALSADGTLYIVDASGNSLLSWTAADGLALVAAWPQGDAETSAVPTSVAIGAEGDIYVGFLGGYPFTGSKIEVWGSDGKLKTTYEKDLNLITDVLVTADGSLYAVQLASGFGDTGYNPDSGSVVKVSDAGVEVIAGDLPAPYGLAQDKDGNLWASIQGMGGAPDNGEVVMVASM
jgi:hypothetical protein